ncbi:hypothetical protein [Gilvimarinus chinensis]|uniref:hypothetical protein n=1 Tax=Gilvimarinus chinensis TaxID=396005 RepID=UPI00037590CD|nr:hypothetical protein [Gilvimarinus chinensis]
MFSILAADKIFGSSNDITKAMQAGSISNHTGLQDYFMGSDVNPDHEASHRMAGIYRADWQSYLDNYAPYDAKLRDLVMGDADNQEAIDRARETTRESFDTSRDALKRNQSRMGLSLAQDEADVQSRRSQRASTLAEVNAANQTRLHMQDRDMLMMAGGMAGGLKEAATNPVGGY